MSVAFFPAAFITDQGPTHAAATPRWFVKIAASIRDVILYRNIYQVLVVTLKTMTIGREHITNVVTKMFIPTCCWL
jgi:hypothetical protein